MLQKFTATTVVLVLGLVGPVSAETTVIASLGHAPLLGPMASTPQMQREVREHFALLQRTANRLGVSPQQYRDFRIAVATGDVHWVEIPRHLDTMSWASGNDAHVIRDVMIPAHTHGWEVDVASGNHILALYMPAACGNLATLRKAAPKHIALTPTNISVPQAAPVVVAASPPEPDPVVAEDVPEPTIDLPPPPKAKRSNIWGFFVSLLAAGVGIAAGSGDAGTGTSTAGADAPCP